MKIDKSNPRHWILLILQGANTLLGILCRPVLAKPQRPRIIFYGHQYAGNIKALYEQWQASAKEEIDCYCLFLDPAAASAAQARGVNVLRCHHTGHMLKVALADVIVTDHGLHTMAPLLRFTPITFVDVWHGIPFKGFSPQDFLTQHRYNEVWVSSPLLKTLYTQRLGFSATTVHPMGYARADKLFDSAAPETSFKAAHNIESQKKLVLYAPTWEHDDQSRSQMPFGQTSDGFFSSLANICEQNDAVLVVRSHLNTSIETGSFDNVIFCPMSEFPDTESLLQETAVLLCDWSSIAFDFLATKNPTLFLDVKPPFKEGYSLGPEYRFGAVVKNMDELNANLAQALASPALYWERFGQAHASITDAVYSDNADGKAGARQLERLTWLASNR